MITPIKNIVHASKVNLKCPHVMKAEYITIHNTANDATAKNEITYMISNASSTSFHYAIDDKEVWQGIEENKNAWHCGDGNGNGNRKSIGLEICYSKSGGERYKKAEALAIQFTAQLLFKYGWNVDRVKKHHDWSGKNCPHRILDEKRWESFKKDIEKELTKLKNTPKKPTVTNTGKMYRVQVGAFSEKGNADKIINELKAKGYNAIIVEG